MSYPEEMSLTPSELREVADLTESIGRAVAFYEVSKRPQFVSIGDVPVIDSNGDQLGRIVVDHNSLTWRPKHDSE